VRRTWRYFAEYRKSGIIFSKEYLVDFKRRGGEYQKPKKEKFILKESGNFKIEF
jgi:hypothetical protein